MTTCINSFDALKTLAALYKHTKLHYRALVETNYQLLDDICRHDILCHQNARPRLLANNTRLIKKIAQSETHFRKLSQGSGMLFQYVMWGLEERVRLSLREGFNANCVKDKSTPLIFALDRYLTVKLQKNDESVKIYLNIINDLVEHGSIIYGSEMYKCPHDFAMLNNLHEILEIFEATQRARIAKIAGYITNMKYSLSVANNIAADLLERHVDFMTLSSAEQTQRMSEILLNSANYKPALPNNENNYHLLQLESQDQ
jgi:hypothetical protein